MPLHIVDFRLIAFRQTNIEIKHYLLALNIEEKYIDFILFIPFSIQQFDMVLSIKYQYLI